jgi:cytochrome c biogenesis protein CcmG/thiol:disulfide interchange protein DsbE
LLNFVWHYSFMKHLLLTFAVVLAISSAASAQTELRVGSQAPQFAGTAIDGNDYDLSQMHGHVVVVTFWSTRCQICQSELPKENQMIRTYAGKDVTFLALTADDESKVRQYLQFSPQEAHVVPNSFGTLLAYADKDKDGRLNFGYPAFYVIDKEGRIAYKGSGWDRTTQINSAISTLLSR